MNMKLCLISDTHGSHGEVTFNGSGDVLIHCGDISNFGHEKDVVVFLDWFSSLDQFKYKIFVAGNHDSYIEEYPLLFKNILPKNIIYLENSDIIIDGVKFFGTPNTLTRMAFYKDEDGLRRLYQHIPTDVDVFISHTPPYGILDSVLGQDRNFGSESLLHTIQDKIKPIIHCFGHIHDAYGIKTIDNTTYINSSQMDEEYNLVNKPIFFEL